MRVKIDTDLKVIQVEQQCKLVELFDFVKKIFPDNKWKEYSIEAVPVIVNWYNPVSIPFTYTDDIFRPTPDYNKWEITCSGESKTFCIQTN